MTAEEDTSATAALEEFKRDILGEIPGGVGMIVAFEEASNALMKAHRISPTGQLYLMYLALKITATAEQEEEPAVPPTH